MIRRRPDILSFTVYPYERYHHSLTEQQEANIMGRRQTFRGLCFLLFHLRGGTEIKGVVFLFALEVQ